MIDLYQYIEIGGIVAAFVGVRNFLNENVLHRLFYSRREKLLREFVFLIVIAAIWPVIVLVLVCYSFILLHRKKLQELSQTKKKVSREEVSREEAYKRIILNYYNIERQHLLEQLTVQEIERREVVIADPLHAVPDLPFGHLHSAWKKFLDKYEEGDELWSFSTSKLGYGYVIVRNGTLILPPFGVSFHPFGVPFVRGATPDTVITKVLE